MGIINGESLENIYAVIIAAFFVILLGAGGKFIAVRITADSLFDAMITRTNAKAENAGSLSAEDISELEEMAEILGLSDKLCFGETTYSHVKAGNATDRFYLAGTEEIKSEARQRGEYTFFEGFNQNYIRENINAYPYVYRSDITLYFGN